MVTSFAHRMGRHLTCAGALVALACGAPVCARTITVTSNILASFEGETLSHAVLTAQDGDIIDFDLPHPSTITFNFGLTLDKDVTIVGPGSDNLVLDGNFDPNFFMLTVAGGHTLTISGLQISAAGANALINNGTLTLDHVVMANNSGSLISSGTLTVNDSTFRQNTRANFGGAISGSASAHVTVNRSNFFGNGAGVGGAGIYIPAGGTLVVNDSAFVSNVSDGAGSAGRGGAILSFGNATVKASTFSGNASDANGTGGAIESTGSLIVDSSTFAANVGLGGGGAISNLGTATVSRTIVVGDCNGTAIVSAGDNIGTDTSCFANSAALNDRQNLDPHLGGLGDFGGGTITYALLPGSPAIDAVIVNAATCSGTDQRGAPRPMGTRCDIGAFEFDPDRIFASGFD
ncbi:choice-of-anchor Q domain-containing protein [Dokdonella sp.]|uniref:choice-of-anchor Q domain-containing protein n=1 Tax=Dokdonella sp. TaxID=2291710 RepID=UPI003784E2FB